MAPLDVKANDLRELFLILHYIDKSELEAFGVIAHNAVGGSDWRRFNADIGTFVLKLNPANREALCVLIREKAAE